MPHLEYQGVCPICEKETRFVAENAWYRDHLFCNQCWSIPRERALALVLEEIAPEWRAFRVHESSAADRGISAKLKRGAALYEGTQFFPGKPMGGTIDGFRNEDLERLTFQKESFDLVVTLDVMEHVYHPDKVFQEIWRTLKPRGLYLCTFPVRNYQVNAWERRFEYGADGQRIDHKEPEIHGNPVDDGGSIVTVDWGYDLHKQISEWAPFDVRVYRFADKTHGILGEYTEVICCKKCAA